MPLHLSTTSTLPDSLGIAKVNGFYGPAIDLFRQLKAYQGAGGSSNEQAVELSASIAAAVTITYWGLIIAISQFWICLCIPRTDHGSWLSRRCVILLAGSLIPALALANLLRDIPGIAEKSNGLADILPALYWDGIGSNFHLNSLRSAGALGAFHATFSTLGLIPCLLNRSETNANVPQSSFVEAFIVIAITALPISSFTFYYVSSNNTIMEDPNYWDSPMWIPVMLLHPLFLIATPVFAVIYLMMAVFSGFKIAGKSCFFMPCTPQSIAEWDQAFGLMVGLVMLGLEMGLPTVRWIRKKIS